MAEASQLVLLQQLHDLPPGTKVRFLACVQAYNNKSGHLTLSEPYSITTRDAPIVMVNLDSVLETVTYELVAVGAWLNVVGYVRRTLDDAKRALNPSIETFTTALVDATLVWSAGVIKLDQYKAAVRAYQMPLSAT